MTEIKKWQEEVEVLKRLETDLLQKFHGHALKFLKPKNALYGQL